MLEKLTSWLARRRRVQESYPGASKMGKGKRLKTADISADFQRFEDFFYKDSHVFGIITTIADSMAEAGLVFIHPDKDLEVQANEVAASYELDKAVSELTISSLVFGNSFVALDPSGDFDFLEQLSPKHLKTKQEENRLVGWEYSEGSFNAVLSREQLLHIPINRLAGSTWGTSPLQPLTRILDLKANLETNLNNLVVRYLVPRYVYLLGRQGTSVPQNVIDDFAKSLADPEAAQDQVFENNLEIQTLGTQYKALHVGYILDYVMGCLYVGLAFPDSFHIAKGSTEATAKIQMEIFNKKRIGGLQKAFRNPVQQILKAILEKEGISYSSLPIPTWGPLSSASLEAKVDHLIRLAGIADKEGNRVLEIKELRRILKNELGFDLLDQGVIA